MGKTITSKKSSSSKQKITPISKELTTPNSTGSLSSNIYSFKNLPLNIFFDICVDGDLNLLVIEGEAERKVLDEAWTTITLEYAEIVSPEAKRKVKDERRIELLKTKSAYVATSVHMVFTCSQYILDEEQESDLQEIIDKLTKLLSFPKISIKDKIVLLKSLQRMEALAKRWTIEVNQLLAKNKDKKEDKKAAYADFERMLTNVSIHFKMDLDSTKITVLKFALYYKRMQDELTAQKQNNGRVNNRR